MKIDETERIIARLEQVVRDRRVVLVGGQAVTIWASRLEDRIAEALVEAVASRDIDLLGNSSDLRQSAALLDARVRVATFEDRTPLTGVAIFLDTQGHERRLDVMASVYGMNSEDIRQTAIEAGLLVEREIGRSVGWQVRGATSSSFRSSTPGKGVSMPSSAYEPIAGDLHRHGALSHVHPHDGPHQHESHDRAHGHSHEHEHSHGHGHSHGLVDESIKRSREGIRAVSLSLAVLGVAALLQTVVFIASSSVALLADLIHNFGDALTAVPLATAFALRSHVAERRAGLAVVAAIFASACVAAVEAIRRLLHPAAPSHLWVLALAGAIGYMGNYLAARIRLRAGRRLDSHALIADGHHARADAYVSLAVIASAIVVALGAPIADPIIGLLITLVILRITWQSWRTVRGHDHRHDQERVAPP